jgi:hypothetical protein
MQPLQNITTANIVVLANSWKHGEHCIAGKCLTTKKWIRPVSDLQGGAISNNQAKTENIYGRFNCKPLQKVTMGLTQSAPLINQPDNQLIDHTPWLQKYKISNHQLRDFLDFPMDLWGTTNRVTMCDISSGAVPIGQSLYLVKVNDLQLYINEGNKKRVNFTYNGQVYDLPSTDPNFDKLIKQQQTMEQILCISLASEWHGQCFKVVATIF